ncbi:MAG: respiratory-chain NADH dehydrogenase domain-containing protein [Elusimicrobia bacterium]|nr:MAG: respiratory-chain NADH dehydrogenase domain-containing protein [Elusimicrobiota bacterium]KAF0158225.1 MAG: respiratory-chain NADH dehydrogenase domain-containing protein [Elusimicrobiota bacterium]
MSFQQEFAAGLRAAGVVGAGGAGFPAYVKAGGRAEFVLVNAAECEPLLKKDQKLLELYAEKVFDGLALMMKSVGASSGIFGIKKKHEKVIKRLEEIARTRRDISVGPMGDYYPAGDEQCLVAELTGRIVPAGGIPLDVGCVVCNVETLYNAARAGETPVVEKWITVAGAVKKPATFKVPVGVTYAEAVELCGGATVKDAVGIDGGPMMGKVIPDLSTIINRASGGLIVLPREHPLIQKKSQSRAVFSRIGKSACDQCSFCTEFCPRYLLGHQVQPHRVMRSLLFAGGPDKKLHSEYALACCECSLCSLYACPEGLHPREACVAAKGDLRELKTGLKNSSLAGRSSNKAHPLRDFRKVPVSRLVKKLGLEDYLKDAPYEDFRYRPGSVRIQLSQHIGAPCSPTVKEGRRVRRGEVVGDLPADKLGCPVHASVDGVVTRVNHLYVEIKAD